MLFNSLAFGFFITGFLHAILPAEEGAAAVARQALQATVGTALQLVWDIIASMMATCPCAHRSLPGVVQSFCKGIAACCLSVHSCLAVLLTLISLILLGFEGSRDEVFETFITTKISSFIGTIPSAIVIYGVMRKCEGGAAKGAGMV